MWVTVSTRPIPDHLTMSYEVAAPIRSIVDGIALTAIEPEGGAAQPNPIVMVHGGCHGSWQWEGWQRWFAARGWGTVAMDWRSHGESAPLDPEAWLERPATAVSEDIGIACDAAGADPVVLAHSLGGLASLSYAALCPERVAALGLLAPVVPAPFAAAPIDIDVDLSRAWGPPPPEMARQLFFSGVDDETAEQYVALLQPESPAAIWQATRWTGEVDVARVRAPALVVTATDDLLVPSEYVRALGQALGAEEIIVEGAGHGLTLNPGWDQLAERIHEWLIRVTAPTTK